MRLGLRLYALVACAVLAGAACTLSTNPTANVTPSQVASGTASASPSSSASGSPSTSSTPSTSSSPSASPSSSPAGAPLAVTSVPVHNGEVGLVYAPISMVASGGAPPYSWSITAGALPAGLNLSTGGSVTGTPTAVSHPGFTVTVQDSGGATATANGSINVFAHLAVTAPCAGQCNVEDGCTICGAFGTASGGATPYAYSVVQGAPPIGMGLNGLTVTGTFQAGPVGSYQLSVVVTDQLGVQARVDANWYVFPHITIGGTSPILCGNSPSSCSLQIPYSGGTPNANPALQITAVGAGPTSPGGPVTSLFNTQTGQCGASQPTGTPPPGITWSASGGVLTVNIGPPDNKTWCYWAGRMTIRLVDQSPCGPGNCASNQIFIDISI